jgi:hypothetical protein
MRRTAGTRPAILGVQAISLKYHFLRHPRAALPRLGVEQNYRIPQKLKEVQCTSRISLNSIGQHTRLRTINTTPRCNEQLTHAVALQLLLPKQPSLQDVLEPPEDRVQPPCNLRASTCPRCGGAPADANPPLRGMSRIQIGPTNAPWGKRTLSPPQSTPTWCQRNSLTLPCAEPASEP